MKKITILFILIFFINCLAFSFDVFRQNDNLTGNVGASFFMPVFEDENAGKNLLGTLILSSLSIGLGYHFNIIEDIFCPGIYGDLHFNLLMLLTDNENINDTLNGNFFFCQSGIRIYNKFKIELFDIQPFVGLNFMFGDIGENIFSVFGLLLTYYDFGVEYSYQPMILNSSDVIKRNIHRIVYVIKL